MIGICKEYTKMGLMSFGTNSYGHMRQR
uniref:Uncharacterized protein n=1 Tax=Anguilla anguilla TaxID=7936 RepID=A0A0E9XM35_ANGAN